jgi:putative DNA primase/helicase
LAFWTAGDAEQIDRLFRCSALFRKEKWDEEHRADGRTYGQVTVAKAVAGTQEFYRAKKGRP